jgi:O-antigen/teichoic acid export membrane protein
MTFNKIKSAIIDKFKSSSNYFTIAVSVFIARGLGGLITILIIRAIGGAEFASFSAGFFIMTILGYSTTGLDKSFVFQYVHQKRKDNKELIESYLWLKLIMIIFLGILAIIISYFSLNFIKFNIILLIYGILYSISFWFFTLILSMYQAQQNFKKYGLIQIIYYMVIFILTVLLIFANKRSSELFLLAYFLGIFGIIPLMISFRKIRISYYKDEILNLLNLSKWLIISELCWLLFIRMDYFTVSNYLSKNILGEYAIALRSVNILSIFVSSLSIYILPKVAEITSKSQLRIFWKKSNFLTFSLLLLGVIIFVFAKQIIIILYGTNHMIAIDYFRKMIIAYSPMFFIPPFKNLILKFNNKIHYFIFNMILIITYFFTLPIYNNRISHIYSPIYSKATGFLIVLSYGIILYCFRDRNILQ